MAIMEPAAIKKHMQQLNISQIIPSVGSCLLITRHKTVIVVVRYRDGRMAPFTKLLMLNPAIRDVSHSLAMKANAPSAAIR